MTHKLVIVICLVVIGFLGFDAKLVYDHYKSKQAVAEAAVKSAQTQATNQASRRKAAFLAGVKKDEAQCLKDIQAYAALSHPQKLAVSAPDCEVNLVK